MSKKTVGVRIEEDEWYKLEADAKRLKRTMSDLARDRVMLGGEFSPEIQGRLDRLAKMLRTPRHEVIEVIVTDFVAKVAAEAEVFGEKASDRWLKPFMLTPRGLMRGEVLLGNLKRLYVDQRRQERATAIARRPEELRTDAEKDFLDQYRAEMEDLARLHEMTAEEREAERQEVMAAIEADLRARGEWGEEGE
jgi:hypothetical protein